MRVFLAATFVEDIETTRAIRLLTNAACHSAQRGNHEQ